MEIKLSKEGLTRTGVIILLLSGLVFHDFFLLPSVKLGVITITYLRVILVVCIPLLMFFYKVRINKNDILAYILVVFLIYGLTRIEGNLKEAFALYCPLVAFFILYCAIDDERTIKKCVDSLAVFYIFFCLVGIYELITKQHLVETHFDLISESKSVACGMYYNENDFSAFLTVMTLYMLLSSFKKHTKVIFISIAIFIISMNKSVISLLAMISFLVVYFIIRKKRNKFFRFVLIAFLAVLMIKPVNDLIQSSSLWWRSYMYSIGIKNVLSHMLIGTGIGKYAEGMLESGFDPTYYGASSDPHNLFYELAGMFGIVWGILLIVLLIKLLLWNFKRHSNKYNLFCFGLIFMIPFVGFASSSCMEKNYIYLALLIPAVYYRLYTNKQLAQESSVTRNAIVVEYK